MDVRHDDIAGLLYTYAERIDAGDFDGVAALLEHAELTFEGRAEALRGRDAVAGLYGASTRRYGNGTPRTKHVITNVIVEPGPGDASAASRSYFTVLQAVPGGLVLQPVVAGRYRHRFEHVEGSWRVSAMHVAVDLVGDVGHHLLFDLG